MALIRATALVVILYAHSIAVYVFISEFVTFATVYYFFSFLFSFLAFVISVVMVVFWNENTFTI